MRSLTIATVLLLASAAGAQVPPQSVTPPGALLAEHAERAGTTPSAERSQAFYNKNFGRAMGWGCASCHTRDPRRAGKNDATDKPIAPLAPAAEASRFTDRRKVDFFFKIHCIDVVGRECTAAEKADLLAWLVATK